MGDATIPHARFHGLEATQTERRFDLVELDGFRYTTPDQIAAFHDHLVGLEDSLRLLKAEPGLLTVGTMSEYLMRRTDGVVGLLAPWATRSRCSGMVESRRGGRVLQVPSGRGRSGDIAGQSAGRGSAARRWKALTSSFLQG
ncbi:hypothetical protein OG562_44800 [Streptomyces sp. NBC_01275]|uniref:hypothetical protein n=1 Tax=Streptomyces sp. NBC_01275 TaxID=2903807 RepID=UPI00225A4B88|nr:hypothetical protein [Streptomyces sp. NBC_01275]MCX4767936.1 hypothetical protein [Streptomyces sp. NBC_01275]